MEMSSTDLHVHFHANQTHFDLNGFARGLVLKMRQRATRKWSDFPALGTSPLHDWPDMITLALVSEIKVDAKELL